MTSIPTNLIKIIVPYRLMMGSWSRRGGSTLMFMLKYIDARFGCKVSIRDLGPSTLRVKWDGVEQVPWTKRWKTQKEYSHPHGWMFTHHQASLYAMPGGPIPPKVKSTTCKSRMKLSTQAHKEERKNKYALIHPFGWFCAHRQALIPTDIYRYSRPCGQPNPKVESTCKLKEG